MKVFPVPWLDRLPIFPNFGGGIGSLAGGLCGCVFFAMILRLMEIPLPPGQRPLCVLLVVYRIWAFAEMHLLEYRVESWVPESVFSGDQGTS